MVQNIEEVYTSKRAKKRPRQNSSKSKEKKRGKESKFENYNSFFEEPIFKEPSFQEVMK